jgi:hypothetical protein
VLSLMSIDLESINQAASLGLNRIEAIHLGVLFGMSRERREMLKPGLEVVEVLDYIRSVNRLADLPDNLIAINRADLVTGYQTRRVEYPFPLGTTGSIRVLTATNEIFIRSEGRHHLVPQVPSFLDPSLLPAARGASDQLRLARPWKVVHTAAEVIYDVYRDLHDALLDCRVRSANDERLQTAKVFEEDRFPRLGPHYLTLSQVAESGTGCGPCVAPLLAFPKYHPTLFAMIREQAVQTDEFYRVVILLDRMRRVSFRVLSSADRALSYYLLEVI